MASEEQFLILNGPSKSDLMLIACMIAKGETPDSHPLLTFVIRTHFTSVSTKAFCIHVRACKIGYDHDEAPFKPLHSLQIEGRIVTDQEIMRQPPDCDQLIGSLITLNYKPTTKTGGATIKRPVEENAA